MAIDETTAYVHTNTDYMFSQIKKVLKDTTRGGFTREQCATALREFADRVEAKRPLNQLELDTRTVKERLRERNMI